MFVSENKTKMFTVSPFGPSDPGVDPCNITEAKLFNLPSIGIVCVVFLLSNSHRYTLFLSPHWSVHQKS